MGYQSYRSPSRELKNTGFHGIYFKLDKSQTIRTINLQLQNISQLCTDDRIEITGVDGAHALAASPAVTARQQLLAAQTLQVELRGARATLDGSTPLHRTVAKGAIHFRLSAIKNPVSCVYPYST